MKFTNITSPSSYHFPLFPFIGLFLFVITSCQPDVSGCTNVNAENYNADAINDDGSCILARDKFLGVYDVNELCNANTYTYEITLEAFSTMENSIVLKNFGNYALDVVAVVSGANLSIDNIQNGIQFKGSGSLSGTTLTLNYTASENSIMETCAKTCTKQ